MAGKTARAHSRRDGRVDLRSDTEMAALVRVLECRTVGAVTEQDWLTVARCAREIDRHAKRRSTQARFDAILAAAKAGR